MRKIEKDEPYILPTTAFLVSRINIAGELREELLDEISKFIKKTFPKIDKWTEDKFLSKFLEGIKISTLAKEKFTEKIESYERLVEEVEEVCFEKGYDFPSGSTSNEYIKLQENEIKLFSLFFSLKNKKKNPVVKKRDVEQACDFLENILGVIISKTEKYGVFDRAKKKLEQVGDEERVE